MNSIIKFKIENLNEIKNLVIDELTSQGIASFTNNELEIQPEMLYSMLPTDRMILGIPHYYPFTIEITTNMNIYKKDSKLKYYFKEHYLGDYLFFERDANLLFEDGKLKYLLSKEYFNICKLLDRYNLFSGEDVDKYRLLSRISQLAKQNDLILPVSLRDGNISVTDKLSLDFRQDQNGNDIELDLTATIVNESSPVDLNLNTIKPKTNFAKITKDKSVRRLYFDNQIGQIISKIKGLNNKTLEEKIKFISSADNDMDLNADIIDLSKFSKRVIEYGYYKPRYFALVKAFKSDWIPGYKVDKGDSQEIIYMKNEDERQKFEQSINESLQKNKDFVKYVSQIIPIKKAQELNSFFKKQLSNPKAKPSIKNNKVLIIEENINELKYNEKENDVRVKELFFKNPPNIKENISLLPHQKEGIAWLLSISENYKGCLLADDMGLGKTLQILSFIDIIANETETLDKKILIIAPISLLENWQNEYINFFNPTMRIINVSSKTNLHMYSEKDLYNSFVLTNYETVKNPKNQLFFAKVLWDMVIIDEAQKIKTPGTRVTNAIKSLKSNFKIAMTGTPVENTLLDLWSIVDFTTPGLLGSAKKFKDDFDKPLQSDFTQKNLDLIGKELRNSLGNTFKRRLKKNTVELCLPQKKVWVEEYEMPTVQKKIYMEEISQKEENVPMLSIIQNLRNISDHPYLKHYDINDFSTEDLIEASAKLKGTISILSKIQERQEKVIIFTEFRKLQYLLRKVFLEYFNLPEIYIINGLTATQKTHNNESRQSLIDKFSNLTGFQIVIMSPIAAGVGLNITAANNVIHYTRHWNPAKESQATDRVYRIGQNKPVNIYYPMSIMLDFKSFDLILDELLKKKTQLSDYTMFPTPITEVKLDDFKNVFNMPIPNTQASIDKQEILKLENEYFQSFVLFALRTRFREIVLNPINNTKGIDIIGLKENQSNENYLIKIIYPKQDFYSNIEKELILTKKYFDYTFNIDFKLILVVNNNFVTTKENIEVIMYKELLKILEKESVTYKKLNKINQARLNSLSELVILG